MFIAKQKARVSTSFFRGTVTKALSEVKVGWRQRKEREYMLSSTEEVDLAII